MTFDELVKAVHAMAPTAFGRAGAQDAKVLVGVTTRALGYLVDEATGELAKQSAEATAAWKPPGQRNVRFTGQRRRK